MTYMYDTMRPMQKLYLTHRLTEIRPMIQAKENKHQPKTKKIDR